MGTEGTEFRQVSPELGALPGGFWGKTDPRLVLGRVGPGLHRGVTQAAHSGLRGGESAFGLGPLGPYGFLLSGVLVHCP